MNHTAVPSPRRPHLGVREKRGKRKVQLMG